MCPGSEILLDATSMIRARSWLILGGEAALAVGIAGDHPGAFVRWQPDDLRERHAVTNSLPNLGIDEPGVTAADVNGVVIASTPDRDLARRRLLMARRTLASDGRLFIAGANTEGIRAVIGDAKKLFGPAVCENYRSRQRVAEFDGDGIIVDLPDWAAKPGVAPGTWVEVPLEIGETRVSLVTQAGVFAGGRIDAGTRLLLEALPDRISGRVLDVGCGTGAIGIAAALLGADAVDLTDVNLLAIQAARENVRRLSETKDQRSAGLGTGLGTPEPSVQAFASDVYSACGDERYDLIVSNPPFHRGKAIDFTTADQLISEAPRHLADDGSLLVVANAFLAYSKRIERVFMRVETVAATRGYQVLRGREPR